MHLEIKKAYDFVNITNFIKLRDLNVEESKYKNLVTDVCYAFKIALLFSLYYSTGFGKRLKN